MARSLIMLVAATALFGCSSAAANGPAGEVKLGVDVAAIQASASAAAAAGNSAVSGSAGSASAAGTTNTSGVVLERVRVLVADAKIGYIGGQSSGASAEVGPYVIDLSAAEIAGGAHRELSLGKLPGGTYGGAEIEIQPLAAGTVPTDPAFTDFVTAKASVLVDGTYDGKAFQFAGHFLAEQGTDGDVTVDAANPVTIAMTVDPEGWFKSTTGATDPTSTANHAALAVAICKTLDTQPQTGGGAPGTAPQGRGGRGPSGGGGGQAHCVEVTTP